MRPSRPPIVGRSSASSQRSQRSARHVFNPLDDPRPQRFKFPSDQHLIVTTARGVYTCGSHGITEIFRSGSNGIVAAKRASNGSGILAVADDQVVILHDVRRGMRRSYRLRSADGRIRMLRYAKDPDRLFFTTTLQNAVQVYDLDQAILLDPINDHPSPPTVFALSSTSHLLLSASAALPVIKLTNLLLKTRPLILRPQCSSADVVVVEFHPERGNLFMLCFADGTCAVYDAAYVFRDNGRGERRSDASRSEIRWELAHIKNLHISRNATLRRDHGGLSGGYPLSHDDLGIGITAAAFVPSHKSIVVTVGSDGRCCVVNFASSETGDASILHTWEISSSATSLSVLSPNFEDDTGLPISAIRDYASGIRDNVVAIGCSDGQVLFFDVGGTLLLQQALASDGLAIIDLAWMVGDDWPKPAQAQPARIPVHRRKSDSSTKSLGSVLAGHRSALEEVVNITTEDKASGRPVMNSATGPSASQPRKSSQLRRTESDPAYRFVEWSRDTRHD
ncbi:MAG: hypothetical protein Q9218_005644 [Villophora microphyllina]